MNRSSQTGLIRLCIFLRQFPSSCSLRCIHACRGWNEDYRKDLQLKPTGIVVVCLDSSPPGLWATDEEKACRHHRHLHVGNTTKTHIRACCHVHHITSVTSDTVEQVLYVGIVGWAAWIVTAIPKFGLSRGYHAIPDWDDTILLQNTVPSFFVGKGIIVGGNGLCCCSCSPSIASHAEICLLLVSRSILGVAVTDFVGRMTGAGVRGLTAVEIAEMSCCGRKFQDLRVQ
jgi:hypothetical protein